MFNKSSIPLIGGIIAGIGASLCCVGPLVLLLLGFGGAWVSNLTLLEPYRPLFIGAALIALSIAYSQIFKPKSNCEAGKICAKPQTNRLYKYLFSGVTIITVIAISSPYLIALFY
jgi:mercuric ion transport protein